MNPDRDDRSTVAQTRGKWAEDLARRYLVDRGLTTVDQNYRCKRGEIDLIMREGNSLVFVEVRYRRRSDYGSGADSVGRRKRDKLIATAQHYLQSRRGGRDVPCRLDVVSISSLNDEHRVEWIKNAFEA